MNPTYLNIGGLVAMGFDTTGRYLLTVSHSGRTVYSTETWEKVGRDRSVVYPHNGICFGIDPIGGEKIAVVELNYETGKLSATSPDEKFTLYYFEGMIEIRHVT